MYNFFKLKVSHCPLGQLIDAAACPFIYITYDASSEL